MNPVLIAGVWLLVTLDCALIGYRMAMGRSALLDKRHYYQRAIRNGALAGLVPLSVVTLAAVLLVSRAGPNVAVEFNNAMERFLIVGGCYAAIILAATSLCALPSVTVRTAASVIIFGPLTLLRPLVVVLTIGAALGSSPSAPLAAIGLLIAVPGIAIEPILDRRTARQLTT